MLKDPSVWGNAAVYALSFDIYLPAVLMKPVAQTTLRKVTQDTARRTKISMGIPESRYKDEWRLKSLDSAPRCEACFWDVSDLEVSADREWETGKFWLIDQAVVCDNTVVGAGICWRT
jgi:hypothetical protein